MEDSVDLLLLGLGSLHEFQDCDKPYINPYWTTMILFTGPHPTNSFQKCSLGKPLQINLSQ